MSIGERINWKNSIDRSIEFYKKSLFTIRNVRQNMFFGCWRDFNLVFQHEPKSISDYFWRIVQTYHYDVVNYKNMIFLFSKTKYTHYFLNSLLCEHFIILLDDLFDSLKITIPLLLPIYTRMVQTLLTREEKFPRYFMQHVYLSNLNS